MASKRFLKNLETWSELEPRQAVLISTLDYSGLTLSSVSDGIWNIKSGDSYFHDSTDPIQEAKHWFSSLSLKETKVLYVFGIGAGNYFHAAKDWLNSDSQHYLVFLEDDLRVIARFLETDTATEFLAHPRIRLHFFKKLEDNEGLLDGLYWNFAMSYPVVSALLFYETTKKEIFESLRLKIEHDATMKNALVDEYLRFGSRFYLNFYPNMLQLPGSYSGNQFFGKFRNIPAIICGAGPSLGKHLEALKGLHEQALIFAGGSAVNALNTANVLPHFGAGIDPNPMQFERLITNTAFEVPYFYRNRLLHDAFKAIHGPRLYITGSGGYDISEYYEEALGIQAPFLDEGHNVVNFCLQIAAAMGCDPIIFVGLDLGFTGMKCYAPGVVDDAAFHYQTMMQAADVDDRPIIRTDIFGESIYTLWKWVVESEWITTFAKEHPETRLINATEGGIGCPNIKNLTLKEVIQTHLTKQFDLQGRIHGETQNARMPQVTTEAVVKLTEELKESLKRCMEQLDILIEENSLLVKRIKKEKKATAHQQTGRAALSEMELADEPGYKYILDIYNQVYSRILNRELQEIRLAKRIRESTKQLKRLAINEKRLRFLREGAAMNCGQIDEALKGVRCDV